MKEAIQKAIEGGWKPSKTGVHNEPMYSIGLGIVIYRNLNGNDTQISFGEILLNPLFWQALGKAMGLENSDDGMCSVTGDFVPRNPAFLADCSCHREACLRWDTLWHRFIDHIAEGKDVDEFFNNLLTNKKYD